MEASSCARASSFDAATGAGGFGANDSRAAGAFSAARLSGITPIVKRGRVGCIACGESGVTVSLSGWISLQLTGAASAGAPT